MKSGAAAFGTPEYVKATLAGGQLARRYGIPFRTSNGQRIERRRRPGGLRERHVPVGSLPRPRQLHPSRRRLDGGWARGQFREDDRRCRDDPGDVRDPVADRRGTMPKSAWRRWRKSVPAATSSAPAHTLERYEKAFYAPILSDWRNYESWVEAGSPDAALRANRDLEAAAQGLRGTAARSGDSARNSMPSSPAARPKAASTTTSRCRRKTPARPATARGSSALRASAATGDSEVQLGIQVHPLEVRRGVENVPASAAGGAVKRCVRTGSCFPGRALNGLRRSGGLATWLTP